MSSASPPVATTLASTPSSARIARDDALDLAGEAVDGAGLQRLDRGLADRVLGLDDVDLDQLGGARRERLHGDLDAGRDRAAEVVALSADHVEVRGRAEVDDDDGRAVRLEARRPR